MFFKLETLTGRKFGNINNPLENIKAMDNKKCEELCKKCEFKTRF